MSDIVQLPTVPSDNQAIVVPPKAVERINQAEADIAMCKQRFQAEINLRIDCYRTMILTINDLLDVPNGWTLQKTGAGMIFAPAPAQEPATPPK